MPASNLYRDFAKPHAAEGRMLDPPIGRESVASDSFTLRPMEEAPPSGRMHTSIGRTRTVLAAAAAATLFVNAN